MIETQQDERLEFDFLMGLKDFMDQEEVNELDIDIENEAFQISSLEQAGFFARKLKELRDENETIKATAKAEIERITSHVKTWQEQQLQLNVATEEYFLSILETFAANELEDSKVKSIKTPFGKLAFSKQQPEYIYDDKLIIDDLEARDLKDYLKYKPSVDKVSLKKAGLIKDEKLYIDNKEVPGITVKDRPDKFDVK